LLVIHRSFLSRLLVIPPAVVVYRSAAGSHANTSPLDLPERGGSPNTSDVSEIVWQSGQIWPLRSDPCTLILQVDSNLVLYAGRPEKLGKALWSSRTEYGPENGNAILFLVRLKVEFAFFLPPK